MPNHFAIPVKDLEKSKKFYEILGFEVFNHWERPTKVLKALWMKDKSGYKIELIYHPSNENLEFSKIPEAQHLAIAVSNIETMLEKLQKKGIEIVIPLSKGITVKYFAFVKDPNGFSVELVED